MTESSAVPQLGLGVVGLHEGRTLLVALTQPVPGMTTTRAFVDAGAAAGGGELRAPHVRAIGGCDLREDKIAAARSACPDLFFTTSYDELLARDDIAVVAIYTPDALHGEHIVRAFEAGKHVICTKPLVNSLDDARRVLQAGWRTGRRLLVGQSTRFFEPFRRQRAAFEAGQLGKVELVDAHYIHRMDWYYDKSPWVATDTDWVYLGLSHPVDLVRWYLGPIAEVQAFSARSALADRYRARSSDIYTVNLRSADGRIGRVMGHYGLHELPSARNAIELMLYGAAGTSQAQYHDMRYTATTPDGADVREDYLYSRRGYYFNNEVHGMHYGEFANYAEYFVTGLLEGSACSPELEEGVDTYCVMEAIRRSAETGAPIQVDPLRRAVGL